MTGVPAVLLDQVAHQATQARVLTVVRPDRRLVQPVRRDGIGHGGPGAGDRGVPQRVQAVGGVIVGDAELPVFIGIVWCLDQACRGLAAEPPAELDVLDHGQVLEQATQGEL